MTADRGRVIVVATISVVALSPHGSEVDRVSLGAHRGRVGVSHRDAAHALDAAGAATPLAATISAIPPLVLVAITHLTVELNRRAPLGCPSAVGRWFSGGPDPNAETAEVSAPTRIERDNHRQEDPYATRFP